ncbi:hypothetical protein [Labrys wisconsinensis]|uniref:Uncharacterized protein n=1 Tax=Labrys wisconsinensis TaxID=425677 RepID=A0ABU0JI83_9HYPH|nr:hypothetical protein [Labrys wisconsinensis]MDQ0472832.1 hypothetical protein [Labrys wisconsinensis]
MSDVLVGNIGADPPGVFRRLKDMGDGTWAERVAVESAAPGGNKLAAGIDRSGSITAGGSAQQLAAGNPDRKGLKGQNISAGDLWIKETDVTGLPTAAIGGAGSFQVQPGAPFKVDTNQAVSVVGATTGQKWTATEI